jgi:hypothetical protein
VISFDFSAGRLALLFGDIVAGHVHRSEHVLTVRIAVVCSDGPGNRKRTTMVLPLMKGGDSGRTALTGFHFHDSDTGAPAGLAVSHYRCASHVAMHCEKQRKGLAIHGIR